MDVLKDFLISTFFEAALALLWICVLIVAYRKRVAFAKAPIATIFGTVRRWVKAIHKNKTTMPVAIIFVLFSYPLGIVVQRVSDDFIETTSVWMPKTWKGGSYKGLERDEEIKKRLFQNYEHLVRDDVRVARSNSKLAKDDDKTVSERQKVVRDTRSRRTFGSEHGGVYINRLLELVRICQAAAMNLFLLFFVLLCLTILIILRAVSAKHVRSVALAVFILLVAYWTFVLAPSLHETNAFNFRVLVVFLLVDGWLFMTGFKLWNTPRQPGIRSGWVAARGLLAAAFTSLALCYFATFSWAEHRENYEETVLILGEPTPNHSATERERVPR